MLKEKIENVKTVVDFVNSSDLKKITEDNKVLYKINYIKGVNRLKRGLYSLDNNTNSLKVANVLVKPSYISLETILSYNSLIPDAVTSYLSVTINSTKSFKNKFGAFYYYNIKKELYFGYKYENDVFVAEKEKALLDYFYLKSSSLKLTIYDYKNIEKGKYSTKGCINSMNWFKEERFENLEILDFKKLVEYSKRFNKKTYYMTLLLIKFFNSYEQKFREIS